MFKRWNSGDKVRPPLPLPPPHCPVVGDQPERQESIEERCAPPSRLYKAEGCPGDSTSRGSNTKSARDISVTNRQPSIVKFLTPENKEQKYQDDGSPVTKEVAM